MLTGAPTTDEARITAAELVWLTSPSSARSLTIRLPIVFTIVHPPITVPTVTMVAHASSTHTGEASVEIVPWARSRATTIPTAFCASLAP